MNDRERERARVENFLPLEEGGTVCVKPRARLISTANNSRQHTKRADALGISLCDRQRKGDQEKERGNAYVKGAKCVL